jgi:hypothetical protein
MYEIRKLKNWKKIKNEENKRAKSLS